MRKVSTLLVLIAGTGLLFNSPSANAAFHIMRVWEIMGGAGGNNMVQYVELRMPVGGQNFIATHEVCFFDDMGVPKVRMAFTANAANGPIGVHSILLGTAAFDAVWAAGSPDFEFGGAGSTMTSLNGGVVTRPVQVPGGKVGFGDYDANCNNLSNIDSVAYGTTGPVTADYGTKLAVDLPITGTQAIKYKDTIPLCHPNQLIVCPRSNNDDYTLVDANTPAGNQPRNNLNETGPVACVDADGDCVGDGSDLCPATAPPAPVDANGCSQAEVDADADGVCDPGAPSGGPAPCTGTDNCPATPNTNQSNTDASLNAAGAMLFGAPLPGDASGDACDTDDDNDQFTDDVEGAINTSPLDNCPAPAGPGPGGDSWPLDINASSSANVSDLLFYKGKTPHAVQEPTWSKRMDLDNNNTLNVSDILKFKGKTPSTCN